MSYRAEPFRFPEPLKEGLILARPNRFVMIVRTEAGKIRCHCPTTGRLGDVSVANIPCLYRSSKTDGRKTEATVEAISFDPPHKQKKSWIGINQTEANRYVEFFLRTGQLQRMASGPVQREVKLRASRIDFLVGDTYVEVKTPLITLPTNTAKRIEHTRFDSFDRLIKHMGELGEVLRKGKRAVIALCYLYDAEPFTPPKRDRYNARVLRAATRAAKSGVETWQVNLGLDEKGVRVLRYLRNVR